MSKEVTRTAKKMGRHRPCVPCSVLYLLLLLLLLSSLLSTGSFLDPSPHPNESFGSSYHLHDQESGQNWHNNQTESDCWGAFDLYFILDKSGSVENNWINIYSFVADLVARYKNPSLRMSFIVFSRDAKVIMPLTANRDEIYDGLNRLQWVAPGGYTLMQEGFKRVNEQIMRSQYGGRKVASVIIALTDGMLMEEPFKQTKEEADKSRSMGAIVYTVGVLDYDKDQMMAIADTPGHMFGVNSDFKGLKDIVNSLASKSCLEVTSVEPPSLCVGEPYMVVFTGQGFQNAKGSDQVICRFKFSATNIYDEKAISVEDSSITCPGPKLDEPGQELSVELSLNSGASFIGNKFNLTSIDCVKTTTRQLQAKIKPYLKFLPALLLIPLLLCCCWMLWRRKFPKKLPAPPPEPETPEKEPPPTPQLEKGNMDSCCNYVYSGCRQMPLTSCQPRVPGRCPNITLLNPHCAQDSCGQKICIQPSRKYCHLTQPPCASRTCAQPIKECYPLPRCTPRICRHPSRDCFTIPEEPSTPTMHLSPSQENIYAQCYLPSRCSKSPSRMLPLLSPFARKSADFLGPSRSHRPTSKSTKIYD
ncbi:PREDICTED: anthrax toxin receptor-like isoform X2 [Chinchilla lanigera]|uniref:anthrax toxin receptor-like isoform X2 n=1 Tax=Chinchilla lanigera TaxID=34839 RepID=UPI00069736D9|nr:PREDICTED: anthrax toxin receptor-like isoform X2 [Chinchilla lanigera]